MQLLTLHPETFERLRLSTYHSGSRKWRLLRSGLLLTGRVWPGTPDAVIRFTGWLERRRPVRLLFYCDLALDYCYWVGASAALRENRRAGRWPDTLPRRQQGALS